MARFRKIDVRMWGDARFLALSRPQPNAQTLWVYLLTGPHTTSIPGLFAAGGAALAEALGWPLKAFREAFGEAHSQGMVKADFSARVVWIPKAINYNPPESANVVKSWRAYWDEIPECGLKVQAHEHLKGFLKGYGEGFAEALQKACGKPSRKPWANQEQEPEQEPEQEQDTPPKEVCVGAPPPDPPTDTKPPKRFKPPTVAEVAAYCRERGNSVDAEKFVDHYTSKGWVVGRSPMKDWKAAVRSTWEKNNTTAAPSKPALRDQFTEAAQQFLANGEASS